MPIATAATITATTRLLSPLISDIYKSAKGVAAKGLARWGENTFPRRLAKKINNLAKVKTLWSPDEDISLLDFYYPPNLVGFSRSNKKIDSIQDLGDGNIVIQGIVGQGKSIFLRYLAIKDATCESNNRLPIFIELRTLQQNYSLSDAIYKTLAAFDIDIDADTFEHIAKSGRLVLLLDAFDELDEALIKATLMEISHLTQRYPELQIIVTSRPGNEIQKVSGFRTLRIFPLNSNDYGPFMAKLKLGSAKVAAIKDAIKQSPSKLSDLITTPLMLTLVVIVYESEKEIPPTLPEFFERLFQVVFTRHDRLKAGFNRKRHSGLSERRLQGLFEAFCFMVLQNSFGRSLSAEQFSTAFDNALEYSGDNKCDEDKFRLDVVKVACLMLEEGIDTTTFLHKSVLEYYAAAFIKHSTDEVAKLFYQAADEAPRVWTEVIRFLSDIDPYRYSKDFALDQLGKIRSEFISPLSDREDRSLLKSIRSIHPSFGVSYSHIGDGQFEVSSYGPFNVRTRIMYESLDDLLVSAIQDTLSQEISRGTLEDILGYAIDDQEPMDDIEIELHSIFSYGGADKFWQAVDIFQQRLEEMEIEANEIISQQEKRKLIFQRRKSKD